jgi:hypothetical protein
MRHRMLLPALGLVALSGCVFAPPVQIAPSPARSTPPPTTVPLVRADQVTPQSAHMASQALADELDREAQRTITTAPP